MRYPDDGGTELVDMDFFGELAEHLGDHELVFIQEVGSRGLMSFVGTCAILSYTGEIIDEVCINNSVFADVSPLTHFNPLEFQ